MEESSKKSEGSNSEQELLLWERSRGIRSPLNYLFVRFRFNVWFERLSTRWKTRTTGFNQRLYWLYRKRKSLRCRRALHTIFDRIEWGRKKSQCRTGIYGGSTEQTTKQLQIKEYSILSSLTLSVSNPNRLIKTTNWKPKYNDLSYLLKSSLDWYKKNI